jgi:hypothetical protein
MPILPSLLIVASDTALDHFVTVFVACPDERNEIAAAKAKRASPHHDDELQQFITHRSNSDSLAIFAAILLASSPRTTVRKAQLVPSTRAELTALGT